MLSSRAGEGETITLGTRSRLKRSDACRIRILWHVACRSPGSSRIHVETILTGAAYNL